MHAATVCNLFVNYYQEKGHQRLSSASLLDPSIPMSFVMSAGLVQVEKSLAQIKNRDSDKYVLVQKCFRHFDVEKVGNDEIHLSFFMMPGAFIFGESDCTQIIQQMWEFATKILELPKERLWASYFQGDMVLNTRIEEDLPTRCTWLAMGLPPGRVVGLGKKHNFWIQGNGLQGNTEPRKCGPNTELFYDKGQEYACTNNCLPGCNCGRFVEFSNTLFIRHQIDHFRQELIPIVNPFTETVVGAERVAMLTEKVSSIFQTKEYRDISDVICSFIDQTKINTLDKNSHVKVIADHLKALYHLVSDGAPPPGKDGRQRIIKILIRRIFARQMLLGITSDLFLRETIHTIASSEFSPTRSETCLKLGSYFAEETARFSKTIKRGRTQIERVLSQSNDNRLSLKQISILETQWGIPGILTDDILESLRIK